MTRRLGETHAARYDCLVDFVPQVLAQFIRHLRGEIGAGVVHRQHDPFNFQAAVQPARAELDARHQIGDPFERVVFALHRDQYAVCRDQSVHSQQLQRRGTVDADIVVVAEQGVQSFLQDKLPLLGVDEFNGGRGQFFPGRDDVPVVGMYHAAFCADAFYQHVVGIRLGGFGYAHP